jgi:hypothetical protein
MAPIDSGGRGILIIGGTGVGSVAAHYCDSRTDFERANEPTGTLITGNFDTSDYSSVTFTYNFNNKSEEKFWINYWHAIEMRKYWHSPKEIGRPFKAQIRTLKGFARSKLHKHKLKPVLCLN